MIARKKSGKALLQAEFEKQQENLQRHAVMWQARWDSIVNPFEKVSDLNSPDFKAEREKVLAPWRAAKEALQRMKNGVRTS